MPPNAIGAVTLDREVDFGRVGTAPGSQSEQGRKGEQQRGNRFRSFQNVYSLTAPHEVGNQVMHMLTFYISRAVAARTLMVFD
jgi:hypothetical protein